MDARILRKLLNDAAPHCPYDLRRAIDAALVADVPANTPAANAQVKYHPVGAWVVQKNSLNAFPCLVREGYLFSLNDYALWVDPNAQPAPAPDTASTWVADVAAILGPQGNGLSETVALATARVLAANLSGGSFMLQQKGDVGLVRAIPTDPAATVERTPCPTGCDEARRAHTRIDSADDLINDLQERIRTLEDRQP